MSKYLCIVLAALTLAGCVRSEVRDARRERPPLREVFAPPSVEEAMAAGQAGAPAPATVDADASADDGVEEPTPSSLSELPASTLSMESEFAEARSAIDEEQQAAAETAAQDVAAAASASVDAPDAAALEEGGTVSDEAATVDDATQPEASSRELSPSDVSPSGPVAAPLSPTQAQTLPRIVVSTRPAILVPLYGKPRMVNVPGTALTRIENTPAIVLKGKSGNYYVPVYDGFMQSKRLDGTWTVTKPVPKVLFRGKAEALKAGQQDLFAARPNPRTGRTPALEVDAPRVIVSSQPTALVLVDGQPGFQAVAGTQLSRLVNSDAVMFRNAADRQLYLQVGERWYRAAATGGPWNPVSDDGLPADIGKVLKPSS